jgi:hypothetical protein
MNWQDFLTDNQIEWVSRGKNTARGEISIRCPWCGNDDPSQHLGINMSTGQWGCLRNPEHRGHSTTYLIGYLLGCSQHQARMIVDQYSRSDPDQIDTSEIPEADAEWFSKAKLVLPETEALPELRPIRPQSSTERFWNYLQDRGFDIPGTAIHQYKLQCCLTGPFKDRLIIPLYQRRSLIAWTGRALGNPVSAPRYLSSKRVKETIFGEDDLMEGGKLLFIAEGVFDAMKLDHYGRDQGVRATCGFGISLSMEQIVLLNSRRNRFKKTLILFDRDAVEPAFIAKDWLPSSTVTVGHLPEGVKDPGELSKEQVQELINEQLLP